MMRIVLTNVHNDDNRGSCALTWAALDMLWVAFPDARIAIVPIASIREGVDVDLRPDAFRHTRRRYRGIEILPPIFDGGGRSSILQAVHLARRVTEVLCSDRRRAQRHPTLEWIRGSDLVVSRGGVIFHTYPGMVRGDLYFVVRALGLLAAQKMEIPVVLLGAQMGPFSKGIGYLLFRTILKRSELVFTRDVVSSTAAAGLLRKLYTVPDTVFGLSLQKVDISHVFHRRGLQLDGATLALVISSELQGSHSSHAAQFANVALALRESGLINQILIVLQAEHDREISLELARVLNLGMAHVVDEDLDPLQLAALYAACKLVVSSRLHAVILSFLGGTPAISAGTGVTFKERAVLDLVGLSDLCVPAVQEPQPLVEVCVRLCERHEAFSKRIAAAVAEARAALSPIPYLLGGVVKSCEANQQRTQ